MTDIKARHAARLGAVQALYQMEASGKGVIDVMAEFETFWLGHEVEGIVFEAADHDFFRDLLSGMVREQRALDPAIHEALSQGWPLHRLEAVLRAILRAGTYELKCRADVPAKAVISEYVDVAHAFFEGEEPGIVNAVLDRLARAFRGKEMEKP